MRRCVHFEGGICHANWKNKQGDPEWFGEGCVLNTQPTCPHEKQVDFIICPICKNEVSVSSCDNCCGEGYVPESMKMNGYYISLVKNLVGSYMYCLATDEFVLREWLNVNMSKMWCGVYTEKEYIDMPPHYQGNVIGKTLKLSRYIDNSICENW